MLKSRGRPRSYVSSVGTRAFRYFRQPGGTNARKTCHTLVISVTLHCSIEQANRSAEARERIPEPTGSYLPRGDSSINPEVLLLSHAHSILQPQYYNKASRPIACAAPAFLWPSSSMILPDAAHQNHRRAEHVLGRWQHSPELGCRASLQKASWLGRPSRGRTILSIFLPTSNRARRPGGSMPPDRRQLKTGDS
jgi:hypothetical protein